MNRSLRKMIDLKNEGRLSNSFILMYGIQGNLPSAEDYQALNSQEKSDFWRDRIEARLGSDWEDHIDDIPFILRKDYCWEDVVDWKDDGF